MNYATTINRYGNYQNTPKPETKTIAPRVRRICRMDAKNKGCGRNHKGQKKVSSNGNATNAFLKTQFLPKLKVGKTIQYNETTAKKERDFYNSLSKLAKHYSIAPSQTEKFQYPYNMALAIVDIKQQLKNTQVNWEDLQIWEDHGLVHLTSLECYNTGMCLYYIPVIPLYKMLKNPKQKKAAQLLLSVCSYLYHVVDIPYYRQEDSFLHSEYEMLNEWLLYDEEETSPSHQQSEIVQAEKIGDIMEQKIFNQKNLDLFGKRLKTFKPQNNFDKSCLQVASLAMEIFQKQPLQSIFKNANIFKRCQGKEYDEDELIATMNYYISFCADVNGWLGDTLIESVNNTLQEYTILEEPVIVKHFNQTEISEDNSLEFEISLFDLLNKLIDLLTNN